MELTIFNPEEGGFLKKIDWNFEELKNEISKKSQEYMNLVYSESQIKEAKKDRAALNRLITALETKRKEIKKEILMPYQDFETKEKELVDIIKKAVNNIDGQVKGYEKGLREEKKKKVEEIYNECIGNLRHIITFEKAFKESYLNSGTTLKSVREEMTELYTRVETEMRIINGEMSPYVPNMKQEYMKNLDLAEAMAKKNELEEAEKLRKQEEERRQKIMEERERFIQEQAAAFEQSKKTAEPVIQAPEMAQAPSIAPEGNVIAPKVPEPSEANLKRKRIVISITANETQFEYLNKALGELKANSEELKVLEKEDL